MNKKLMVLLCSMVIAFYHNQKIEITNIETHYRHSIISILENSIIIKENTVEFNFNRVETLFYKWSLNNYRNFKSSIECHEITDNEKVSISINTRIYKNVFVYFESSDLYSIGEIKY